MKRKPLLAAALLSSALFLSGMTVLAEDQAGNGAINPDGIYYSGSLHELYSLEIQGSEAVYIDRYFEKSRSQWTFDADREAHISIVEHDHPMLEITTVTFSINHGADGSLTGDPDTVTVSVRADEETMNIWLEDWGVSDQESLQTRIKDKFITAFCQHPITIPDEGRLEVYSEDEYALPYLKPMDDPSAINGTYICEDNDSLTLTLENGTCTYDNGSTKSELPYVAMSGADYGEDGYLIYITDFEKFMSTDLYDNSEEYSGEIEGSDINHIEYLADKDWYKEGFAPDKVKETQETVPDANSDTDSNTESYTVTLSGADGSNAHSEVEGVQYSLLAKTGTKSGTYQPGESVDISITDSYSIGYVIYLNDDTSNPIEGYGSGTVSFTMPANDVYVSVNYYSG